MLAVLFILGTLCPLNFAALQIGLLNDVLFSRFPNAFLLSPPDCKAYANENTTLLYMEENSNESKTVAFLVPSCSVSHLGYFLENLKNGTTYNMHYQIANVTSANLTATTTNVLDYQQIDSGLEARSGAMVVITVILTLAMVILLVGLIISVFFSS